MSAWLFSGGVEEGSNFIVLFLDFNLDFSRYDALCAGIELLIHISKVRLPSALGSSCP
jgi:hypothetical protein